MPIAKLNNTTVYNLDKQVSNWQQGMLKGALTPDDVEELAIHIRDEIQVLQQNGLTDEEAWLVAMRRMGEPVVVDAEFNKVNRDYAVNRDLLMMFWGGTILVLLQTFFLCFQDFYNVTRGLILHIQRTRMPVTPHLSINLFHLFSAMVLGLVVFSLTKADKIFLWFNNLVVKRGLVIVLLLITIGWYIILFNNRAFEPGITRHLNEVDITRAYNVLSFVFYNSLIFCTAWLTMRYRKKEFRTAKVFFANINWFTSLCIGIIIQLFLIFGNIIVSMVFKLILSAVLFLTAGYVIGKSRKPLLNLFIVQSCSFITTWLVEYRVAGWSFKVCSTEYIIAVLSLLAGFVINKHRQTRLLTG